MHWETLYPHHHHQSYPQHQHLYSIMSHLVQLLQSIHNPHLVGKLKLMKPNLHPMKNNLPLLTLIRKKTIRVVVEVVEGGEEMNHEITKAEEEVEELYEIGAHLVVDHLQGDHHVHQGDLHEENLEVHLQLDECEEHHHDPLLDVALDPLSGLPLPEEELLDHPKIIGNEGEGPVPGPDPHFVSLQPHQQHMETMVTPHHQLVVRLIMSHYPLVTKILGEVQIMEEKVVYLQ